MPSKNRASGSSRAQNLLHAATSVGWVSEFAALKPEQIDELTKRFGGNLSGDALGRFSRDIKYVFHRAQALQVGSARLAADATQRHSRTPRPNVETQLRDEIRALQPIIARAVQSFGAVNPIVVLAVDEHLDDERRRRFWPPLNEGEGMEVLLRRATAALSDLNLALSEVKTDVSPGRRNEATRMTIESLAMLYLDVRGRLPKRTFTIEESGEFLEFARAFMGMVRQALPPEARSRVGLSLSKVVREVLAELCT